MALKEAKKGEKYFFPFSFFFLPYRLVLQIPFQFFRQSPHPGFVEDLCMHQK